MMDSLQIKNAAESLTELFRDRKAIIEQRQGIQLKREELHLRRCDFNEHHASTSSQELAYLREQSTLLKDEIERLAQRSFDKKASSNKLTSTISAGQSNELICLTQKENLQTFQENLQLVKEELQTQRELLAVKRTAKQ